MNIFDGVEFNQMMFIGPLIILAITMVGTCFLYATVFKRLLPPQFFNFFLGPVALFGAYIWAVPMNLGFHEYFKMWGS